MKQKVALVLSSGGSKGLAQIGAIQELERQGFEITSISGSSIGSVIGGLYAMGKLNDYTDWIKTLNKKLVWGLMDFSFSTSGLLKGIKVFEKMKTFIPDVQIEEMKIPFTAVATDIINQKEVIFNSGSFYETVRASVSIPTIITPVKYQDTFLVDGGVLNPVPIEHVKRNENDILVVVNLYADRVEKKIKKELVVEKNNQIGRINSFVSNVNRLISSGEKNSMGYFALMNAATSAMLHKLAKQNIEKYKPDILINIPHNAASTFDFHKAEQLIELGLIETRKEIANYKKVTKRINLN